MYTEVRPQTLILTAVVIVLTSKPAEAEEQMSDEP
jgi:hypothetical protein